MRCLGLQNQLCHQIFCDWIFCYTSEHLVVNSSRVRGKMYSRLSKPQSSPMFEPSHLNCGFMVFKKHPFSCAKITRSLHWFVFSRNGCSCPHPNVIISCWLREATHPGYDFAAARPSPGTAQFTQLVWKGTKQMAMALSEDEKLLAFGDWTFQQKKGHNKIMISARTNGIKIKTCGIKLGMFLQKVGDFQKVNSEGESSCDQTP